MEVRKILHVGGSAAVTIPPTTLPEPHQPIIGDYVVVERIGNSIIITKNTSQDPHRSTRTDAQKPEDRRTHTRKIIRVGNSAAVTISPYILPPAVLPIAGDFVMLERLGNSILITKIDRKHLV